MLLFIPIEIARYFGSATIIIVLILSFVANQKWQLLDAEGLLYENKTNFFFLLLFCILYSIIIGYRPPNGVYFVDSANYALEFRIMQNRMEAPLLGEGDWLFSLLIFICAKNATLSIFFSIVAIGYIISAIFGLIRIFKNNTYGATLFFFGAFSFFSYATNGIRNGLACSFIILALSFLITPKKNWILGSLFCFIAISIHKSTALPVICFIGAYLLKDPRKAIYFWIFSIFLFLTMRGFIENFFSNLGFDDRLSGYIQDSKAYAAEGYKTGFRPDFLLYSFMPIWLGWYAIKRVPDDKTFNLLLSTYVLANSFWIMVMNASFSNRFAYLSWFLYPLVMAYPCLRMNIWDSQQGKMAGTVLLANVGFTAFMQFIYY